MTAVKLKENSGMTFYISPHGNDAWSGLLPEPTTAKTDGPLKTLPGFQALLRAMKLGKGHTPARSSRRLITRCLSGPVTVLMRGGVYAMRAPLVMTPDDSWPVTFKAYRNEKPVISGGERITGWTTTVVNGKTAWTVDLPEVAQGQWNFRQLFVNGRRAERPRLPKKGLYRMREVPGLKLPAGWSATHHTRFVCTPGEVRAFRNLGEVEVVYLHFWIEERSGIAAFDPDTNGVTLRRPSVTAMVGAYGSQLADYYLDNVFEGLTEPGEWYLDRTEGRLFYLPRPGETPRNTEIIAPRCLQLLVLAGNPEENRFVEHLRFEGLRFAHTDWRHPDPSDGAPLAAWEQSGSVLSRRFRRGNQASSSQAASDVPGVICMMGARFCAVEHCVIEHIGWYGLEISDACHGIRVVGNTIGDMGAGGVKINGAAAGDSNVKIRATGHHQVTDNEIAHGGRIFHSAVGVLSMHAHDVDICHNHIHDLFYSGISCGWEWGYQESISRNNLIAFNHIHDLGHRLLSDMGGIYTLGVQPGTVLRNNLIHDVTSAHYGGWCIYPDEGSSHLLIEDNVCFEADRQPFHQHYGRENMIRNNIWLFGGEAVAIYTRREPHRGFTWLRNIMVSRGEPIFRSTGHTIEEEAGRFHSDLNLFHSLKGRPYFEVNGRKLSLKQWQALGRDQHSLVANPKFRNLGRRDFRLDADSPAFKLGFVPIDLSGIGPRRAVAGR